MGSSVITSAASWSAPMSTCANGRTTAPDARGALSTKAGVLVAAGAAAFTALGAVALASEQG